MGTSRHCTIIVTLLCAFVIRQDVSQAGTVVPPAIATTTATVYRFRVITSLPASEDVPEDTTSSMFVHKLETNNTEYGDDIDCTISSTKPANAPVYLNVTGSAPAEYSLHLNAMPGLNYATASSYEIRITCSVFGGPSDTRSFFLYVIPNGMPVFLNLWNTTEIDIAQPAGSTVFEVQAIDPEGEPLLFQLQCVNAAPCPFYIDSTGAVKLMSSLTGATVPVYSYELEITASDGVRTTDPHKLVVFVTGINSAPVITNLPATVHVRENEVMTTSFFTIIVFDGDNDTSFTFSATFNPVGGFTLFNITDNGEVSLASGQTLDFETQNTYTLEITVNDGVDSSQPATLTIQVIDVNEEPVLKKENYSVFQDEGKAGTSFNAPTIEVTDPDLGDTLTFALDTIASDPSCGAIAVDHTTGIMMYGVDYDVDPPVSVGTSFHCFITVTDKGGLPVTATVSVSILDINDNAPEFSSSIYRFDVPQDLGVGTVIGTVSAIDSDLSATFRELAFTLDQSTLASPYFAVDTEGNITLAASVANVPGGTVLSATVSVRNPGSQNADYALLFVTVTPVNRPPILQKDNYYVVQDEGTAGTSFNAPIIDVTDPDHGDTLTFAINTTTSDASCVNLAVDWTNGVIKYDVDYDVDPPASMDTAFYCYITVTDKGDMSVTATVSVSILDINDNIPEFSDSIYRFSVPQNHGVGNVIGAVSATDNDLSPTFSEVIFTLDQSTLASLYFAMDREGNITLAASVANVPGGTVLTATASVKNPGSPDADYALVFVTVSPVNRSPELQKENYFVVQDEGPAGTSFNAPKIEVTDPDLGDTLAFDFDIATSDASCSNITVDKTTGVMKYIVDYDIDRPANMDTSFYCYITVTDKGSASVTATVSVSILDINDNVPEFTSSSYSFDVRQTHAVGTSIGAVSATDDDFSAPFRELTFTLDQSTLALPYFVVDRNGSIALATSVINVPGGTVLSATVSVRNSGSPDADYALVFVNVIAVNRPPVLQKQNYYVVQDEGPAGTSFNAPNIEATDPDLGDTLTFVLNTASDASCNDIIVDKTTGIMMYKNDYDVDRPANKATSFRCLITVEDNGGLSVIATVSVNIRDVNDNDPVFDSSAYFFNVSHIASLGSFVGRITATDNDHSAAFKAVTFTLDQSSLREQYLFIDNNGDIFLASSVANIAGRTLTVTAKVNNPGFNNIDTATIYVTVIAEDGINNFWGEDANIAWVSAAGVGLLALTAMGIFLLCRNRPSDTPQPKPHKVRPTRAPADTEPPKPKPTRSPSPPATVVGSWEPWRKEVWN